MPISPLQHTLFDALRNSYQTSTALADICRGIEKEGLRTTLDGNLALTAHPYNLGSALTNSWLTTDFSESLLEFITPVSQSAKQAIDFLKLSHAIAAKEIDKSERIWPSSMPCKLPADDEIPLAYYGESNIGKMKTTYRRGLGHRYGRAMQTVAGIHYNFSLPESYWQLEYANSPIKQQFNSLQRYIDKRYLDLIRNFRRHYWLLIYLFGAAPVADPSFVQGRAHQMKTTAASDLTLEHATSLRMGDLGYQSAAQGSIFVCYNELDNYIATLQDALVQSYLPYENFPYQEGVKSQLSTALLQIENEFYSPIRPKRVAHSGESPLQALHARGIEYIEVRCLDIDPYESVGISEKTIHFLDAFLLTCLLMESPDCDQEEFAAIGENQKLIVEHGREDTLALNLQGEKVDKKAYALSLMDNISNIASWLDKTQNTNQYSESVAAQITKINDVAAMPSSKLLAAINENSQTHNAYILNLAEQHHQTHLAFSKDESNQELAETLLNEAKNSHQLQKEIEKNSTESFENFLETYYHQSRINLST